MKINIRKLLQEHREPLCGHETIDLSGCDFHDYTVVGPAVLEYTATPEGGSVKLAFSLTADIAAECARCLAPMHSQARIEKEYRLTRQDLEDAFPELPLDAGGSLDLTEFAYQELVLETPPILLCDEDCEGLCARCGKPVRDCACAPEAAEDQIDPRLQGLLQLLEE